MARCMITLLLLPLLLAGAAAQNLKVAAFNIQIFGLSKMEDPVAVESIIQVLVQFDLILIQEIRDSSESAIYDLLTQLNAHEDNSVTYNISISERLGRTSSKEQYAFFYDKSILTVRDVYQYHDNSDIFEREPYIVTFGVSGYSISEFAFLAIHAKPEDAVAELDELVAVYDECMWNGAVPTPNWLLGGDFNADCSYVGPGDWENIALWTDNRFTWTLDNDIDSTVSNSDCAYDRLVLVGNMDGLFVSGSAVVDNFQNEQGLTQAEALEVSDHFAVEIEFN